MTQPLSKKTVVTLNKGLITERGELTFPEDATTDELNCVLNRDGTRQRRLGIQYEDSFELSNFEVYEDFVITTGEWKNVGGVSNKDYLVVQNGPYLYFYDKSVEPLSGSRVYFGPKENNILYRVDLSDYEVPGLGGVAGNTCQFTSINGSLVIVNPAMDTIFLTANDDETYSRRAIKFKVRDFERLGNTQNYTDSVSSNDISIERKYDTLNAGWHGSGGSNALNTYIAEDNRWPELTLPWYAGKDAEGLFNLRNFSGDKAPYVGNSLTGNGHFILDFFKKNRRAVSGINIQTEFEATRFKTVCSFQGRVFYSGLESKENTGRILFSRLLQSDREFGDCFQINDPTSESISDLLDTDGGVISIPEAYNITKLYSLENSLLVFAENGIWKVEGVDGVFRPTEYAIGKVSNIGLENPDSFIDAEGLPFWWSQDGIYTLSADSGTGRVSENNLTLSTIQTFFNNISKEARSRVKSEYDSVNKRLFFLYPDNDETILNKKNNILIFDLSLQAFYPWRIEDKLQDTNYIVGTSFFNGIGRRKTEENILTNSIELITTETGETVKVEFLDNIYETDTEIKFLVVDGLTNKLTVAEIRNQNFVDWVEVDYLSFAESGHDFINDLSTNKSTPYFNIFLRRTEEGFTGDEINGYDFIRPSSIKVSSYWDFKTNPSTRPQQGYRLKRLPVINESNLNDLEYGKEVIRTRLKLRGTGKSVRFRFESESGKDFQLIGYEVIRGKNSRI